MEQLRCTEGCIIGVVGLQGIGKSSALLALEETERIRLEQTDVVLFKWQREKDLYESLLEENHEASQEFLQKYREALFNTDGRVLREPRDMYMIPIR
jgi:dephospho-CoA kinase